MKPSSITFALAFTVASFSSQSVAQSRFCVGGDLDHLQAAQRTTCNAKLQVVRTAAAELHLPTDWHFVLVCGDEGWKSYVSYNANGDGGKLTLALADTHEQERETFLRGDAIHLDDPAAIRLVLKHEFEPMQKASGNGITQRTD